MQQPCRITENPDSLSEEKKKLRREKLAARRSLSAEDRKEADARICSRLNELLPRFSAGPLVAYLSDGTEPDLRAVLEPFHRSGGTLCLPRFAEDGSYRIVLVESLRDCRPGRYGIPEPGPEAVLAASELLRTALFLVPGVAFDDQCRRLGRGKGVYDRLLRVGCRGSIGIFYDCQQCPRVPVAPHDLALDAIVTESAFRSGTGRFLPRKGV